MCCSLYSPPPRPLHHLYSLPSFHYEEFSDVTLGFHDPNIFIAPSGCQRLLCGSCSALVLHMVLTSMSPPPL